MLEVIKEYATAHDEAKNNPRLLIEDHAKNRDLCIERMERVGRADTALAKLRGAEGSPQELINFFAADDDKGCSACWMSSFAKGCPGCGEKIHRWFDTQEILVKYGLQL